MIQFEKIVTDNPFVDNTLYYSKLLAANCTVKDEDEALANETAETLRAGEVLIACVEGTARYEIYKSIPKEILEKYIAIKDNLDIYAKDNNNLKAHLNSYEIYKRNRIYENISKVARQVYANHYEVMTEYIDDNMPYSKNTIDDIIAALPIDGVMPSTNEISSMSGNVTIEELNKSYKIYNNLFYNYNGDNGTNISEFTYSDIFYMLPKMTKIRIFKTYLNNYDNSNIEELATNLTSFNKYIKSRNDASIQKEVANITEAMRSVLISHYEIMIQRGYFRNENTRLKEYVNIMDEYEKCKRNENTYYNLYYLFPKNELLNALNTCIGNDKVKKYSLDTDLTNLNNYFDNYSSNREEEISTLTKYMSDKYLENYNLYINYDVYTKCINGSIGYYELFEYLPFETRKMIINTEIKLVTNLDVYSESKEMLNSYLQTLTQEERNNIKESINKDMIKWYPKNHVEKNNYYRTLIGLPPIDQTTGEVCQDTLTHSWDSKSRSFIEFGDKFINTVLQNSSYPEIHWKQNICDFDTYDLNILNQYGIIDDYIAECMNKSKDNYTRYKYLKYLGDEKLDLYTCRRALNFQLIGMPTITNEEAKNKFIDIFAVNRDYVLRTVYSDAYKFQSDYYNKFMIVFILINCIMDMLNTIPEFIINKEVFDARCAKYLFESYGIPYYSEIPLKYQIAMLKNINTLIKFKSSTKNMIDICSLFGFSDIKVFGYYLFKQKNVDTNTGEYLFNDDSSIYYDIDLLYVLDEEGKYKNYNGVRFSKLTEYDKFTKNKDKYADSLVYDNDGNITKVIVDGNSKVYIQDIVYVGDKECYDYIPIKDTDYFTKIKANTEAANLKFIKVPINDKISKYKNDPDYIITYDEIVSQDEGNTWDGGLIHENLYEDLLDYEFNAVKSKYISVESITEMTNLSFQVSYFYNMLFDNLYSEEALLMDIPVIKLDHKFKFVDIICYLFALTYIYYGLEDNIMYSPTQILYVKGYNFNDELNKLLSDPKLFQQKDPDNNKVLIGDKKYNIFNINDRIAEDNYDYRDAFSKYNIKAFNLDCDIDELDKWLNDNYQMSLDDFVVDDSLTNFNTIITLRNFYSLNNSYYQKNIFNNDALPLGYNEIIKYGYDYMVYKKEIKKDINETNHYYITDTSNNYMEIIDNTYDNCAYIMDYNSYIIISHRDYVIYHKYTKNGNNFNTYKFDCYSINKETNEYYNLFNKSIPIIDSEKRFIFSADKYYTKDENNKYIEVTDEKYFSDNPHKAGGKVLKFGDFYINKNGKWELDLSKCFRKVIINGEETFKSIDDINNHTDIIINANDCYLVHSDGHFIKLMDTDYFRDPDHDGKYVYNEEECYIKSPNNEPTEYYDASLDANNRIYYVKLVDYYNKNNWLIFDDIYVSEDHIPLNEILDPNNCYFINDNGYYDLVINNLASYSTYNNLKNIDYVLIHNDNNDYDKYKLKNYIYEHITDYNWYIINSDYDYITVINKQAVYPDTSNMIVVFNKYINGYNIIQSTDYDPEVTDGIWDENDWYYDDKYAGENKWYYKDPNKPPEEFEPDEIESIGAGFYIEASSYIGNVKLEKGFRYYMSFDIVTNFTNKVQIFCESDDSITNNQDRLYEVVLGESQHVSQVFTANEIQTPSIKFLIYDYNNYPINIGDYIVVSNIKFVKSYNDNFISQDIPSYDKLQELYRTNEAIYKYLAKRMNDCDDYDTYNIYKRLYDSLMISKYNKEAFKISDNKYAKTYTDFLKSRDIILYDKLCYYKALDKEKRNKQINDEIVSISYEIDKCIDMDEFKYLNSYFPAISSSFIQQYIIKVINFFKSWKVHLLGINTVYKFDSELDNTVKILEDKQYKIKIDDNKSNVFIYGNVKINPLEATSPNGQLYKNLYNMDEINNHVTDRYTIHDRVRIMDDSTNEYNKNDIVFNSNITFENNNIEEAVSINNSTSKVFYYQNIGQINNNSTDITEMEDDKDE